MNRRLEILLILALCAGAWCAAAQGQVLDLAPAFRIRNVGGSCGNCSVAMHLNWLQEFEKGRRWWATYRGGEYFERQCARLRRAGVKFIYTTDGDTNLIDYAIKSGRGAIIYDEPFHIRNLQGGNNSTVYVLDNNLISRLQPKERRRWERRWQQVSGIAIVVLSGSPPPPVPET